MSLSIRAWWPDGRFDGATIDPAISEWPPSPARLVAALRASVRTGPELSTLEWLESQPAPFIMADESPLFEHRTGAFVVVNAVSATGGNLTHPGRTNGLRTRSGAHLASNQVTYVWPDAEADSATLMTLNRLAADVPYFGRSTSAVVMNVEPAGQFETPGWCPTELGNGTQLAVPYPGFCDELDDAYESGARAWERYRYLDYAFGDAQEPAPAEPAPIASPYGEPLILRLDATGSLPFATSGLLTSALRRAVMALVPDPIPAELHGHGADGRPHVAFLALPDVGHSHADGHILGLAICAPAASPRIADLVARSLLGTDPDQPVLSRLGVVGIGDLELRFDPTAESPRGLWPGRWMRASRTWTSVTPMVLDRFPRRTLTAEAAVAHAVRRAGYPTPIQIEVSAGPLVTGAQRLRPHQVPRKEGDQRPYRNVQITFAERVSGPVLLGALRHLGFGLCAPQTGGDRA